jgi:TonB family protein
VPDRLEIVPVDRLSRPVTILLVLAPLALHGCLVPRAIPNAPDPAPAPSVRAPEPSNPPSSATRIDAAEPQDETPGDKLLDALYRYAPKVRPGNQRALGRSIPAVARYMIYVHTRIHPIFSEVFFDRLKALPETDPRNEPSLVVKIEIALSGKSGRIARMGVVRSSGVPGFDAGALDAFEQAAPFEPPPPDVLSTDGNLYLHWEFHRDPEYGCSTINARPFILRLD